MWTYHPDLLARPAPRYTSYPTAAEFTDAVGALDQAEAIRTLPRGSNISLYVHIPFCRDICWYCGCNTGRVNRTHRVADYLDALGAEIRTVSEQLGGRGTVSRIAFGGGSPNAISPIDFVRLLDTLLVNFPVDNLELSVELDPRSFGEEWAVALGKSGVSRVSLGVQTFDAAIQQRIGRVQPTDTIRTALARLRRHGIGSVNFDLMYGLPGQDIAILDATLDETIMLRPERIALFGYAHVPHMLPRQRRIDAVTLPGQAERFAMAAHGYRRLVDAGYVAVGFDHFALPGDPLAQAVMAGRLHRNFQGFTEDNCNTLIGFGASAISHLPNLFVQNQKNGGRYRMRASAPTLAGSRGVRISAEDQIRGTIIEALLCGRAADLSSLGDYSQLEGPLASFVSRGLARFDGRLLSISPPGLPYARTVAMLFDQHRALNMGSFSAAV